MGSGAGSVRGARSVPTRAGAGLLALLVLLAPSSAISGPGVAELIAETPLEDRLGDILAGERVTVTAARSGEREMAVAFACLVPPGKSVSLDRFRKPEVSMPDRFRDLDGPIDVADPEGSLSALRLDDPAEAQRYLDVRPGWDLSFSTEEIAALRALDPPPGGEVAAVEGALRRLLAERVRRFHAQGLAGIAPFDRGDGELSSVAHDLQATTKASVHFARLFPEAQRALLEFPRVDVEDEEIFYYWARITVVGRPVFLLGQRAVGRPDGVPMMVDRQFYASRFVAAAQTITALPPVAEGTLVMLINHSFVDRWTGPSFAVGGKRQVGQKLIDVILPSMAETLGLCEGVD